MPIRAVLCDLDNTLIDFEGMKHIASRVVAEAMIRAGAEFRETPADLGDMLFAAYKEDMESDTVFQDFLRKHHSGQELDDHLVDRIISSAVNAYQEAKSAHLRAFATVPETLVELVRRGLKLAVVTDAPRFKAYQRLDAAGLTPFFDEVVTLDETGKTKDTGQPFLRAQIALDVPMGDCLVVGDWSERDIEGGKRAGMRTAWSKYGCAPGTKAPAKAEFVLDRFADLLKITAFHGGKGQA